ncbi:transposase InsO family protein [Streptomyces sp. V4I2]|nr:transposase InsO family protein [Streptomyces sp. V4I2]
MRDAELKEQISKVFEANYHVYGARKIWRELNRQGRRVARCTVERLMRELGITGAVRGKRVITTLPGGQAERAPDLLDRDFVAAAPNHCWVADFTHVKTWAGVVCVAFVVDTFSRRIVGWSAATVKETVFVLDAVEMAIWQRDRDQHPVQPGELIHHSDAGSQYTSFRLAEHLDAAGIAASIGSVGDAYDKRLSSHCTSSPIEFTLRVLPPVGGGRGGCLAGRGAGWGPDAGRDRRSCRCTSRPRSVRRGATSRWSGR